jgi:long-subunit acyl-CoA synthetase (AMP-forming)
MRLYVYLTVSIETEAKHFMSACKKINPLALHQAKRLYHAILREAIKRLDQYTEQQQAHFMLILDEKDHSFRKEIVEEASIQMFGSKQRSRLIEPPIQAESHLYQTLQCADWLCGLIQPVGMG